MAWMAHKEGRFFPQSPVVIVLQIFLELQDRLLPGCVPKDGIKAVGGNKPF